MCFNFPNGTFKLFAKNYDEKIGLQGIRILIKSTKAYKFYLFSLEGFIIYFIDVKFFNLNKNNEFLELKIYINTNLKREATGDKKNCYALALLEIKTVFLF